MTAEILENPLLESSHAAQESMQKDLNILDLFAGIGGTSLGFHRASPRFKTKAFCEIGEFQQKVLRKNFPDIPIYSDVRELTGEQIEKDCGKIDILVGTFPCTDLSIAGRKEELKAERSGLAYQILRLAQELDPRYIFIENVPQLIKDPHWIDYINEYKGYDYEVFILNASDFGYPHKRARVFILLYKRELADTFTLRCISDEKIRFALTTKKRSRRQTKEVICYIMRLKSHRGKRLALNERIMRDLRDSDGFAEGLDRIAAIGNGVIPDIVEIFGKIIIELEAQSNLEKVDKISGKNQRESMAENAKEQILRRIDIKTTSKLSKEELDSMPLATQAEFEDFLDKIARKDYANAPEILKIAELNSTLKKLINHDNNANVFITRNRGGHIAESRKGRYNQSLRIDEQRQIPSILSKAKEAYIDNKEGFIIPFSDSTDTNRLNLIIVNGDTRGNFLITAKKINRVDFENPKYKKLKN